MRAREYSESDVIEHLRTDLRWVERAIVRLFTDNQMEDEQETNNTKHRNDIGFSGPDARRFSIIAKTILKHARQGLPAGQRMFPFQIEMAMKPWGKNKIPYIAKYRKQILEMIAKGKN